MEVTSIENWYVTYFMFCSISIVFYCRVLLFDTVDESILFNIFKTNLLEMHLKQSF